MLGKNLSEALSDISDDKIEAAANYTPKGRRQLWVRVAACAAVLALLVTALLWPTAPTTKDGEIIAVSGVVKAYACELEDVDINDLHKYELTDTVDSYKKVLVPYTNVMGGAIPFRLQIQEDYFGDAEITFRVSADYGWLFTQKDSKKNELTVSNGDVMHWRNGSMTEATEKIGHCGRFYVNVLILADDRIVGYGIIDFAFYSIEGVMPSFVTDGFTTICFPLIDGKFQDVSEEYVWEQIEEYKRTKPAPEVVPMG